MSRGLNRKRIRMSAQLGEELVNSIMTCHVKVGLRGGGIVVIVQAMVVVVDAWLNAPSCVGERLIKDGRSTAKARAGRTPRKYRNPSDALSSQCSRTTLYRE